MEETSLDDSKVFDSRVISLNVGGRIFTTRVHTLSKSTFLTKMIAAIEGKLDLTNPIFLDLDPDAFKIILNFLRHNDQKVLDTATAMKAVRKCEECRCVFVHYASASDCFVCACSETSRLKDDMVNVRYEYIHSYGKDIEYQLKYLLIVL